MKRLAFLTCVRDSELYDQLGGSINALERPDDVEIGFFVEQEEANLAAAYNRLQAAAEGWKYKVYVHDDVVILNQHLIGDLLRIFRLRRIGLLGVAGCRYLPTSAVWWAGSGVLGRVVHLVDGHQETLELEQPAGELEYVEAVDGLFMATQHDLTWDEEIAGFHFYDVAQSIRYVLAGYDVVVPRQDLPWLAHRAPRGGEADAEYEAARQLFRSRYDEPRARFAASRVRRKTLRLVRSLQR
jgi:Glycosyltransferase like family